MSIMDIMTRDQMVQHLQNSTCVVTFTKKNGEDRVMKCTLVFDHIPEENHPKGTGTSSVNLDVIKVYDLESEGWRSFRVDSITDFVPHAA